MKDVDPWLNSKPRLANPGREFKEQYQSNWSSQFEKAPEIFVAVPTELADHAKRILAPYEKGMQLPLETELVYCPLYMFSRFYSIPDTKIHKDLVEQRIPCVISRIENSYHDPFNCKKRVKSSIFYWAEGNDHLQHLTLMTNPTKDVRSTIQEVDRQLGQINWIAAIRYAYVIKTKSLLQGNSNGLPKIYEQSQDWSARQR